MLKLVTFWKKLWLTESAYLVSVRQYQEIASKAADFRRFKLSLSRTVPQKRETVQIFSATLRRHTQTQANMKSNLQKLSLSLCSFEVPEIKVAYGCHRDASHSGRLTTTWGICAFLRRPRSYPHVSWQRRGSTHPHRSGRDNLKLPLFKKISKSRLGYMANVTMDALWIILPISIKTSSSLNKS